MKKAPDGSSVSLLYQIYETKYGTEHVFGKVLDCPINISSIYSIYEHKYGPGHVFVGEYHPFYEINIILEGTLGLTVDDKLYELNRGHGVIIPAGAFHKNWVIGQSPVKFFVVSFDIATNGVILPDDAVYTITDNDLFFIEKVISEGMDWIQGKSNPLPYAPQIIKNCVECIVLTLLRQRTESSEYSSGSGEIFHKCMHYMNSNIKKNITVEELARFSNTSVANLKKIFKKYTGTGAIHHFNLLKLEYSKELLKADLPISEIAHTLSYSSQNHYAQSFKKAFGITPSQFKKS